MVERTLAVGRGRAREVERPQPAAARAVGVPTTFTELGLVRLAPAVITAAMVAMCGALVLQGRQAVADEAGSMVGRSPCRLRMISKSPSGSMRLTASNTRSEPEAWSGRVMTASPPALRTAATISSVSVATTTRPVSAAMARRHTCTISGSPAISTSGLPGSRVACMRAGMTTSVRCMGLCVPVTIRLGV